MYIQISIILAVMIIAYTITKSLKFGVEICILFSAIAGGIVGAFYKTPHISKIARHLVEGSFVYVDVILVFVTATIFIAIIAESGGVNYLVKGIIKYFYKKRLVALILLMFIVLIPGALTGAGSVSILTVGAPIALALGYLGISRKRIAGILFILGGLSAVAPPVNIWAMMVCAGTAIPYVGFEFTLGIPVLILGIFAMLTLGWKREEKLSFDEVMKNMPDIPDRMSWWRITLPFLVFFGLIISSRIFPFDIPVLGLPLQFTLSAIVAYLVSPIKIKIITLSINTVKRLLPLLATMVVVGSLQQIMTVTGVKGLISTLVISSPLILLYILLIFIIPLSEGVLTYGGAAIIGIPLVWYLNSIGLHPTVVIAGLTLLWPLGDGLPPTALIGRLSVMVSEYKGKYYNVLKTVWLPWVIITITAIMMIIFSSKLAFLVEWSK